MKKQFDLDRIPYNKGLSRCDFLIVYLEGWFRDPAFLSWFEAAMDETLAGVVLAQGVPFEGTPALKRAGVTLQLTREYDSYLFRNRLGEVVACNIFYVWYFFVFVPASQIAGCIAALKELNKINR